MLKVVHIKQPTDDAVKQLAELFVKHDRERQKKRIKKMNMEIFEETPTNHHLEEPVMINDDAMEAFRTKFPMVRGCNVMPDGNEMHWEISNYSFALRMLGEASTIINFLNLPLNCRIEKSVHSSFLRIIYNPNKK